MNTLNMDKVEKWKKWLEAIQKDISFAMTNKVVFDELAKVVSENVEHIDQNHGGYFLKTIRNWYAYFIGFSIRRHVDKSCRGDSFSLRNLIVDIQKNADIFTFDFYKSIVPENHIPHFDWRTDAFMDFSTDMKILSSEKIQLDIDSLDRIRELVEDQIDRNWAHLDKCTDGTKNFTYGTLIEGITLVDRLTCKYIAFLTGNGSSSLAPVIIQPWQQIFRVPLIKPIDAAVSSKRICEEI